MARNGLKRVVKTVKGKKRSVRRTYWVKSDPNAGKKKGFLRRHAGKLLGAAALAGGAYLAYKGARGLYGVLSDVKEGMRSGIAGDRFRSYEERDADRLRRRGVSVGPPSGGHIQRLLTHTERGGNDGGHTDGQWYRRLGGTVGEQGNKRPISQRFRSRSLSNLDL